MSQERSFTAIEHERHMDVGHRKIELMHYIDVVADLYKSVPAFTNFRNAWTHVNKDYVGYKGHHTRLKEFFDSYERVAEGVPALEETDIELVVAYMGLEATPEDEHARRLLAQLMVVRVVQGEDYLDAEKMEKLLAWRGLDEAEEIVSELGVQTLKGLQVAAILLAMERGHLKSGLA